MLDMTEMSRQVASWIDDCHEKHMACVAAAPTSLPTRVLAVEQGLGADNVRIHETHGEKGLYAALSYCWGGPQPVMLMNDAYESMVAGIELSKLPRTLQDAVRVTRELGLSYLWIDALCIIQDSHEDKQHELKVMAAIYKDAYITLVASSASTCREGFLQNRTPRKSNYPRFELPYRAWADEKTMGTVLVEEAFHHDPFHEPINRRGWCLQERLLSPRVLMFGTHELLWQCQHGQRIAGGTQRTFLPGSERLDPVFFDPDKSFTQEDFYDSWIDVVIDYSWRDISFESDKLVAMAALAAEFQKLTDGDTYLAGIWKADLIKWLSWIVDASQLEPFGRRKLMPRPVRYVAPSWSWASVTGTVGFACNWREKQFYSEVVRCETALMDESIPTAQVTAGVLELRGPVKETRWLGQILFQSSDQKSEVLGKAFMDADEDITDIISCIRLYKDSGIIMMRKSRTPSIYTRVGRFEVSVALCEAWFAGCELQSVVLV